MKQYAIEFTGTFFLVLVIAITGNPFAIAGILIAMIYMGGYISGAHYNPAVTIAVWVAKGIEGRRAVRYFLAQIAGAAVAAYLSFIISGTPFFPKPATPEKLFSPLILEFLFTFALAFVVLNVAVSKKTKGNQYYGLAIGLTVLAGAITAGPISGAVFNPAVILGAQLADISTLTAQGLLTLSYTVATALGGIAAGLAFTRTHS